MLFTFLVVMAGVVGLIAVFNSRREPSWWDRLQPGKRRNHADGSAWAFGGDSGGGSGVDCGGDAGGCDGGGGGGD